MKLGLLKDTGERKIEFNDYENKGIVVTLQRLLGGSIEYLPLGSLIKDLPNELKNVSLVVNGDERKLDKGRKPNLLIEEEVVVGNVVFIRVDEKGHAISLIEKQISLLPDIMSKLILPQDLKMAFGCC